MTLFLSHLAIRMDSKVGQRCSHTLPRGRTLRGGIDVAKDICSIPNCEKPVEARGWCRGHYMRWNRYGDPEGQTQKVHWNTSKWNDPDFRLKQWNRFLSKVVRTDGCWFWMGFLSQGYGQHCATMHGRSNWRAHRFAWAFWNGPIPDGHLIHHVCHNKACVRPDHLEALTPTQHAAKKGHGFNVPRETHCKNGHPFSVANTRWKDGHRICITCAKEASQRRRERLKAEHGFVPEDRIQRPPLRYAGAEHHGSKKTHCPQGHPYTPDNLVAHKLKLGKRACLTCNRIADRERWRKKHGQDIAYRVKES